MAEAAYYDGETARRRTVSLHVAASGLELFEAGERIAAWPCEIVRRQDAPAGVLRIAPSEASLARLDVTDPADQTDIRLHCHDLEAGPRKEGTGQIVFWSIAATVSLVLCALYLVPMVADRAAPLMPISLEKRLGAAVDNQVRTIFRGKACDAGPGREALAKLASRLNAAGPSEIAPEIVVLSSPITNAIALPGGRIYLFAGLLREARSVDEIAGVLAHEIGHVAARDGLRKLFQTGGTSFLLGLLLGDVTGGGTIILVSQLALDNAYSRDAERAADAFALKTMTALGRPSRPMGLLLKRIDDGEGTLPAWLSSHPVTEERLKAMSEQGLAASGEPLLDDREWRALKDICKAE